MAQPPGHPSQARRQVPTHFALFESPLHFLLQSLLHCAALGPIVGEGGARGDPQQRQRIGQMTSQTTGQGELYFDSTGLKSLVLCQTVDQTI